MDGDDNLDLLPLPGDLELPNWCSAATLRYSFELNRETPSNNDIRGLKPRAYMGLRQWWANKIFARGANGRFPEKPIQRAALVIVRRAGSELKGGLDWDNVYGGLKPVVDCLVVRHEKRNPNGLGFIEDDSPLHMPYPPLILQRGAPPGKGSTHIAIFELPA